MRRVDLFDVYLLAVIALMQVIARVNSARLCDALARVAASAAYHRSRQKRKRMEEQLTSFLGADTNSARTAGIVRESFNTFWLDEFRLALPEPSLDNVTVCGLEHVGTALEKGHGAILMENSLFGQRHLAKQILCARGISLHQVHEATHLGGLGAPGETQVRTRLVRPWLEKYEKQFVKEIIYLRANSSLAFTRRLAEVLQSNQVLCMSGEGQFSVRPILLPFLGSPRKFATGAISLAKMTGAPVLPMYCWHPEGSAWQLTIEPPLEVQAGMAPYVEQLEMYVRRSPEQYRGWHRED
jgi:lauroyl/myristoyl acyltransferase